MKYKQYGVKKGRIPGIYDNWSECEAQVFGFPGAEYKGFETFGEAQRYCGISSSINQPGQRTLIAYIGGYRHEDTLGLGLVYKDHNETVSSPVGGSFSVKPCQQIAKWAPYFVGCYYAICKAEAEHYHQLIICTREPELERWIQPGYGGYTHMATKFKELINNSKRLSIVFANGRDYSDEMTYKACVAAQDAAANNLNPINNPLI